MRLIRLWLVVLALVVPRLANAGDFVDTRLNFTLTDENLLVGPGETNPSIAGPHIGQPNFFGIMFFDNYDTRYTGYENLTHLVLYKKVVGGENGRFVGEAAMVMRFLEFSDISLSSIDDGSYMKITYYLDSTRQKGDNVSFTAFPMNADRMRLGYSYRLSWGGSPIFFKFNPDLPTSSQIPVNPNPAPGARMQYTTDRVTVWGGFKTSLVLNRNPQVNEQVAIYGLLAGAAWDPIGDPHSVDGLHLRLEVNGGYFDRGTNPLFYGVEDVSHGQNYTDFEVQTAGASFQVSLFNGQSPAGSIDYALYRNDPNGATRYFSKFDYRPGFNWLAQSEFTYIGTTLQDPNHVNSSTIQTATAGDLNLRAQSGHLRLKADLSYRSLQFMLINQPSFVPYQDFPSDATVTGSFFFSLGADYNWARSNLTAGLTFGVEDPATFTPKTFVPGQGICPTAGGPTCTASTIVVYGEGNYSILPPTDTAGNTVTSLPIEALKALVREDFLDYFALILDVYGQHDPNQTHLTKGPVVMGMTGESIRDFNHPWQLGFNLTLQARY